MSPRKKANDSGGEIETAASEGSPRSIEQSEELEPLLPDEHFQLLLEELRNLKEEHAY